MEVIWHIARMIYPALVITGVIAAWSTAESKSGPKYQIQNEPIFQALTEPHSVLTRLGSAAANSCVDEQVEKKKILFP